MHSNDLASYNSLHLSALILWSLNTNRSLNLKVLILLRMVGYFPSNLRHQRSSTAYVCTHRYICLLLLLTLFLLASANLSLWCVLRRFQAVGGREGWGAVVVVFWLALRCVSSATVACHWRWGLSLQCSVATLAVEANEPSCNKLPCHLEALSPKDLFCTC